MTNAPFVTIVRRGLVKGAKCLISGREFASTDPAQFEQHWADACQHSLAVLREQDGDQPCERDLQSRQNLYRSAHE